MKHIKKSMLIAAVIAAVAGMNVQNAHAGDRGWSTAGKILTGVAIGTAIASAVDAHAGYSVTYSAPAYCAPTPVVYAPPVCAPAPVVYTPAPVVYVPAPVYYAPRPVVVYRAPVCAQVYCPPVVYRGYHGRGHHGRW